MPKVTKTRQRELVPGIGEFSRSAMYKKSGRFAVKHKDKHAKAKKEIPKKSKMYPVEDLPKPLPSLKAKKNPTKLRSSITPGTVLILLAGRFRGKRVVFLKQLDSGLLLVTGPFKINGVPLRRVNQVYVIATTTKIDVTLPNLDKFTDAYFKKVEAKKEDKGEEEFFGDSEEKKEIAAERIADQKEVDAVVLAAVKKVAHLKDYLNAHFGLTEGQFPHEMKF